MRNKIRELRTAKNKTLADLWLATKIHQPKLSLIERRYFEPTKVEMRKIAKALNTPIKEIFFPEAGRSARVIDSQGSG